MIEIYIGWLLVPELHELKDARYPSLVGVLIINTTCPCPAPCPAAASGSSRRPGPGDARA